MSINKSLPVFLFLSFFLISTVFFAFTVYKKISLKSNQVVKEKIIQVQKVYNSQEKNLKTEDLNLVNFLNEYIANFNSNNDSLSIAESIVIESNGQNVDPFLITAIIQIESLFNRYKNNKDKLGLMQLSTAIAKEVSKNYNYEFKKEFLEDIIYNIRIGIKHLDFLYNSLNDMDKALVAYKLEYNNFNSEKISKNYLDYAQRVKNLKDEIYKKYLKSTVPLDQDFTF